MERRGTRPRNLDGFRTPAVRDGAGSMISGEHVRPRVALLALTVAVFSVSWAAILIRLAGAAPLAIAFWRLALATLILAPVAGWQRARQRRAIRSSSRRASPVLVIAAGTLLAGHFVLWIMSLFLTSVASSVMLVTTQPVFAALIAGPLLGERTGARTWAAIGLSLAGAAVITAGDLSLSAGAMLGDLLAVTAAAAAAVYLVLGRRARHGGPLPIYLFSVNGVATAVLLLLCLGSDTPLGGYAWITWALLLALAVGPHLVGHGFLNLAVRHLPAPAVNLALLGEPILSSIYAAWLFGEVPPPWFYLGGLLVSGGLIVEFGPRRRRS